MLLDIAKAAVDKALRRKQTFLRVQGTVGLDDLYQAAWCAVLEAQESGIIDPGEIQRLAERRIKQVLSNEVGRREHEFPVSYERFDDPEDDYSEDSMP